MGISARSCRRSTSHPKRGTIADAANTATTMPSAPSRVRSSTRIKAIVVNPTVNVVGSMSPKWNSRSNARLMRLEPSASYPVKPSS